MSSQGKFLNNIPGSALAAAFLATLLRSDTTVNWGTTQNAGGQRLTNLGAPVNANDALRLCDAERLPYKSSCVVATTGNITLSGVQTIDGIASIGTLGERVLVWKQTTASQNGIYISGSGAWQRSTDADESADFAGMRIPVSKGTANGDHEFVTNTDDVVVGTTAIAIIDLGLRAAAGYPTSANKNMACNTTTADGQLACATAITYTPARGSYVTVWISKGYRAAVGDGTKTGCDVYFSADSGVTAKTIATITAGDSIYFNGSVAGAQLASGTDTIDLDYLV